MTDPGYVQQDTQTAHSQNLGRREDYGGARPHVVEQISNSDGSGDSGHILHDLTHDMENIVI